MPRKEQKKEEVNKQKKIFEWQWHWRKPLFNQYIVYLYGAGAPQLANNCAKKQKSTQKTSNVTLTCTVFIRFVCLLSHTMCSVTIISLLFCVRLFFFAFVYIKVLRDSQTIDYWPFWVFVYLFCI